MRVIPVIDLLGGQVVRGIGGRRSEYRPIASSLASGSEPATIAHALKTKFGAETVYVADLDAIERGAPDCAAWQAVAGCGLRLMIDAGVGAIASAATLAERLRGCGSNGSEHSVVVGLESLQSAAELDKMVELLGAGRAIFSLDLRAGAPVTRAGLPVRTAEQWANAVVDAGFERLIVLDLADVGSGDGMRTLDLCHALSKRHPELELIAGGGVRSGADLQLMAEAGCSAALVASALHDGRLEALSR